MLCLRIKDTLVPLVNCQRLVLTLGVSRPYAFNITNLWNFGLNWSSKIKCCCSKLVFKNCVKQQARIRGAGLWKRENKIYIKVFFILKKLLITCRRPTFTVSLWTTIAFHWQALSHEEFNVNPWRAYFPEMNSSGNTWARFQLYKSSP